MKRFWTTGLRRWLISTCAAGAAFQIGSCTIDENGNLSVSANLLDLASLQGQIAENGGGFPFGGGRGFGPRGLGGGFDADAFADFLAASEDDG